MTLPTTAVMGPSSPATAPSSRSIALVGANGMLAQMVKKSAPPEYELCLLDLPYFDITAQDQVFSVIEELQPETIINCAAYTNVDGCETEQSLANQVNAVAVGYLAEAAKRVDATLVHISTDYVFDGNKQTPYTEDDPTNPQSVYGSSKLRGEQALLASGLKKYFIVRTSWLYGPGGKNFVETIIRLAKERPELRIVSDQVGTPTYTADLADAIFNLLGRGSDEGTVMKGPLREGRDEGTVMKGPLRGGRDEGTVMKGPLQEGGDGGSVTARSSLVTGSPSLVTASPSLIHAPYGIYHFANEGSCSWYEFACEIVTLAKIQALPIKSQRLLPIRTEEYPLPAPRPAYSVFSKEKYLVATGAEIPGWKDSLVNYLKSRNNL